MGVGNLVALARKESCFRWSSKIEYWKRKEVVRGRLQSVEVDRQKSSLRWSSKIEYWSRKKVVRSWRQTVWGDGGSLDI